MSYSHAINCLRRRLIMPHCTLRGCVPHILKCVPRFSFRGGPKSSIVNFVSHSYAVAALIFRALHISNPIIIWQMRVMNDVVEQLLYGRMKQYPKSLDSAGFSCVRPDHGGSEEVGCMVATIPRKVRSKSDSGKGAVRDDDANRDAARQQICK